MRLGKRPDANAAIVGNGDHLFATKKSSPPYSLGVSPQCCNRTTFPIPDLCGAIGRGCDEPLATWVERDRPDRLAVTFERDYMGRIEIRPDLCAAVVTGGRYHTSIIAHERTDGTAGAAQHRTLVAVLWIPQSHRPVGRRSGDRLLRSSQV